MLKAIGLNRFYAAVFLLGAGASLYTGTVSTYLTRTLPMVALMIMGHLTPWNELKSLDPISKVAIAVFGILLIVWGMAGLFGARHALLGVLH